MKKKGKAFLIIGIILIIFQIMSYIRYDFNSLFEMDDDITHIFEKIAEFIGYSFLGILGIGLLIEYNQKNKQKEVKDSEQLESSEKKSEEEIKENNNEEEK